MTWQERYSSKMNRSSWKTAHEVIPYPTDDEQTIGHLLQKHGYDRELVKTMLEFYKQHGPDFTTDHKMDHEIYDKVMSDHDSPEYKYDFNGIWDDHKHE